MNIGLGLPTTIEGTTGELLLQWAQRADAGPFTSLGVLDRLAYQNYEPFTALAAASAVTHRVRLATMGVIAPVRNTAGLPPPTGPPVPPLSRGGAPVGGPRRRAAGS